LTTFAHIVLLVWIPVTLGLFALLPIRRAVLVSAFGGWMFLPEKTAFVIGGLPDLNKDAAIVGSILLATVIFQSDRLLRFRPTRWDIPMAVWCLIPIISSISNEIGGGLFASIYGGVSLMLDMLRTYGLAYLIGRLYFQNFEDLKELALGFFVAGLVYLPFCLLEIRITPQLHRLVYGFHAHSYVQTIRMGGHRPTVFMTHGLMVGMLLTSALVSGLWLWLSKTRKKLWRMPMSALIGALFVTAVLSRSSGALGLLLLGIVLLLTIRYLNWRWCMVIVLMVPPSYMLTRGVGLWTGENAVEIARDVLGDERAGSLDGRMRNEDLFVEKARERPIVGWCGWGRFLVRDDEGELLTTPDGLWIIALGQYGLVGLVSISLVLLMPVGVLLKRYPVKLWHSKAFGPSAALVTVLLLYMIDCLMNAMVGAPYFIAAGALLSVLPYGRVAHAKTTRRQNRPVQLAQRPHYNAPKTVS